MSAYEDNVHSFTKYLFNNPAGNWSQNTWNVLPAVLTTWSNLFSSAGNQSTYDLYLAQAKEYIDTAEKNARLIRQKGAQELRNIEYKHKIEKGMDTVKAAGAGLNMSGSTLEALVQKEKVRKMDEQTVRANYENQAMITLANGYASAASTYGTLSAKAKADKYNVFASILKGVERYVVSSVEDAKVATKNRIREEQNEKMINYMKGFYGQTQPESQSAKLAPIGKVYTPEEINVLNSSSNSTGQTFNEWGG